MTRLRVLTLNVENLEGDDRRTKAINSEVRRIAPDLVSFQEVVATSDRKQLDAEAVREQQAIALTDLDARHRRELPTIIAGDFNATPDAASIRYLRGLQSLGGRSVQYHDAWEIAGSGPGYTWTTKNPNTQNVVDAVVRQPARHQRFDYVFIGSWHQHRNSYCQVRSAAVAFDQPIDGVWASDHYGVVVDVDIGVDATDR
jgi:endonuclease/exonuclease/phosphatase family metal-dependent hydrolase